MIIVLTAFVLDSCNASREWWVLFWLVLVWNSIAWIRSIT